MWPWPSRALQKNVIRWKKSNKIRQAPVDNFVWKSFIYHAFCIIRSITTIPILYVLMNIWCIYARSFSACWLGLSLKTWLGKTQLNWDVKMGKKYNEIVYSFYPTNNFINYSLKHTWQIRARSNTWSNSFIKISRVFRLLLAWTSLLSFINS